MDDDAVSVEPGVWRYARATRAHVVIDAADYFELAREAMLNARHRVMLIGWDFDTRIHLTTQRRKRGGPPTRLGEFIVWLAARNPDLDIRLLKWNFGALKMLGRGSTLLDVARWAMHPRIQFLLDSAHPLGCSHHQKIVVIDDCFAVCGGIDMTGDRWDTSEHLDDDPRRRRPNGKPYGPWHDMTMLMEGEAAAALAELGRNRWELAGGDPFGPCPPRAGTPWPASLEAEFRDVEFGIARTRAPYGDARQIREIRDLFIEQIRRARRFIYAENQYFASCRVADAIALRMAEPDPPEIVLVNPLTADGWLEQKAMDGARVQLLRAIGEHDPLKRFSIYTPHTAGGTPVYVHAKMMIVDDEAVRVGSANMNNRSLGLDSECDVFLDAARPGNGGIVPAITALRHRLLAEHLGLTEADVAARLAADPSMHALIRSMPGNGRHLRRLDLEDLGALEQSLADNAVLDPEQAEEMFEPFASPGLFGRSRVLDAPG